MHSLQEGLEQRGTGRWYVGSFTIVLSKEVSSKNLKLMKTAKQAQDLEKRTIHVLNGKARDTTIGGLMFHDSDGIPFFWNKKLVVEVITDDGYVLWRRY